MMTTADLTPLGLQAAPDGLDACSACGVATSGPTTNFHVLGRVVADRIEAAQMTLPLPTCTDCLALAARAEAIAAAHPALGRRYGSVVAWRLTTALYALDALGSPIPESLTIERAASALRWLTEAGAALAYSQHFSPLWQDGADPRLSARSRWSGAVPELLAEARRGGAEFLADARPPRPLAHPSGARCEWCGTARVLARRVSEAWSGNRCAACAAVAASGGDWYAAAWEAIDGDHALRRRLPDEPSLEGVKPWSQAHGGNGKPWGHLGGVDALREHVARLLGVSV